MTTDLIMAAFWLFLFGAGSFLCTFTSSAAVEVCNGDLGIECPQEEVIVSSSALFGRMVQGSCIRENKFIGCRNDVLFLADRWCSGRNKCEAEFPNPDLDAANTDCESYLRMYLTMEYTCIRVNQGDRSVCNSRSFEVGGSEGVLSSHVTDETGCGSTRSPLVIAAMPGQTIELSIIDFGSEIYKRQINDSVSLPVYGYIVDGNSMITFNGDIQRKRLLHSSKSSQIQVEILPADTQREHGFLLQYKKIGCPDLTPPTHAWYKRDGDQAVIGCEWSQKTWHLSCDGHSWSGVVGNCSEPDADPEGPITDVKDEGSPSTLWLVCVVSVSVVLMVVACVIGVVCIKKYRIKQDVQKSMTLQRPPGQGHYDLDPNIEMASMLYLPYKSCEQEQGTLSDPQRPTSYLVPQDQVEHELSPIRIWERPLPDLPDKPLASGTMCACPTSRRGRTPGDGDEAVGNSNVQEGDTLQSYQADVSTTPSQGGLKYSALGTQQA